MFISVKCGHPKSSEVWALRVKFPVFSNSLVARGFHCLACRQADWLPKEQLASVAPYMGSGASLAHMISIWTMKDKEEEKDKQKDEEEEHKNNKKKKKNRTITYEQELENHLGGVGG